MGTKGLTKFILVLALLFVLSASGTVSGCSGSSSPAANNSPASAVSSGDQADQDAVYTCPMHPEIVSDKPGRCPTCGMNLVLKDKNETGRDMNAHVQEGHDH